MRVLEDEEEVVAEAGSADIVPDTSEEEERSLEMMKDPSLPGMKLIEREMRVLEDEEEVVAGEASEVAEDLEDHSEEGVISAVDSEDEEDLEEEVDSEDEEDL